MNSVMRLTNYMMILSKLKGGMYIEAEIMMPTISGNLRTNITSMRLIDKDGQYTFNDENPLCYVIPDLY